MKVDDIDMDLDAENKYLMRQHKELISKITDYSSILYKEYKSNTVDFILLIDNLLLSMQYMTKEVIDAGEVLDEGTQMGIDKSTSSSSAMSSTAQATGAAISYPSAVGPPKPGGNDMKDSPPRATIARVNYTDTPMGQRSGIAAAPQVSELKSTTREPINEYSEDLFDVKGDLFDAKGDQSSVNKIGESDTQEDAIMSNAVNVGQSDTQPEEKNVDLAKDQSAKMVEQGSRPPSGEGFAYVKEGGKQLNKHSRNNSQTHNKNNRTKRIPYIKHNKTRKNQHSRKTN
jgi:hypothetical protein